MADQTLVDVIQGLQQLSNAELPEDGAPCQSLGVCVFLRHSKCGGREEWVVVPKGFPLRRYKSASQS